MHARQLDGDQLERSNDPAVLLRDEVAVTGLTKDGDRVPILREGSWQI